MKILAVLFAAVVLDVCRGLQYPLEYQYRFFSSIATGIPEISDQASGIGIKTDVTIQVINEDGAAMVQFLNFEVTKFNDHLGCDSRGDLPSEFAPFQNEKFQEMIEEPFEAHLFTENDDVALVVHEDENLWITNLRKGIVGVMRNLCIKSNFKSLDPLISTFRKGIPLRQFHEMEETIFGICEVDNSVNELPERLAATKSKELEQTIEDDIQRDKPSAKSTTKKGGGKKKTSGKKKSRKTSKTSKKPTNIPPISDTLWHLIRSVNFDNCEDSVDFQFSPVGVGKEMHGSQYKWLRGRSSVADYILRGGPRYGRIERINVEGASIMSPYGINTETLQARTNMTYELVAVREIKRPLKMASNTKIVTTWMQEVLSAALRPVINKPEKWIRYTGDKEIKYAQSMGGEPYTPEDYTFMKDLIIQNIDDAARKLSDLDQEYSPYLGNVADVIQVATYSLINLSKEQILEIFQHFHSKDVHPNDALSSLIFVDAVQASGGYESIAAIIEILKTGVIPYHQQFTLAMTLTSNIDNPTTIPLLMDYVMTIDLKEKPFLGSTVFINFANLLYNKCIYPGAQKVNFPGKIFGDHTCDLKLIKNTFVPFIKDLIYNKDSSDWQKETGIKVIGALGTPFAIPTLRPIIMGQVECSKEARIQSIYALERGKLIAHKSSHVREEILSMLDQIFSHYGEEATVRQAALAIMESWAPNPSFWYRLARSTWREPSKQVASYVTSMIETMKNMNNGDEFWMRQIRAAQFASSLTKPIVPGERYSFTHLEAERAVDRHVKKFLLFENIMDEENPAALNLYLLFAINQGGYEMTSFQLAVASDAISYYLKSFRDTDDGEITNSLESKIAKTLYDKIQNTVNAKPAEEKEPIGTSIFLRVFEHMHLLLPINKETIQSLSIMDRNVLAKFVIQLSLGVDYNFAKYINPLRMYTYHSSEIGLPIFSSSTTPIVMSEISFTSASSASKSMDVKSALNKLEIKSESVAKFVSQSVSSLMIFIPWSSSLSFVEIRANRELNLPLIYTLRSNNNKATGSEHWTVNLDFESYYHKKFPIFRADSQPKTGFYPYNMLEKNYQDFEIKIIESKSEIKEVKGTLPSEFTGLHLEYSWKSSLKNPFSWGGFVNYFLRYGDEGDRVDLLHAFGSPTAKGWSCELTFDPEKSTTKNVSLGFSFGKYGKEKGDISQSQGEFTQETGDYSQYDQNTYDSPQSEVETSANFDDTQKKRSEKLLDHFGTNALSYGVKIDFVGTEDRSYELLLTKGKPQIRNGKKLKKSQLAFFRSPIPGRDDKPLSLCFDTKRSTPNFSPLDTFEELMNTDLNTVVSGDLTVDCSGESILSIEGAYSMSENSKNQLIKESKESCDRDPINELKSFHDLAVYSDLKYKGRWKNLCDASRIPLLTKLYNYSSKFVDGLLGKSLCDVSEAPREMEISAKRDPYVHSWDLKLKRNEKEATFFIDKGTTASNVMDFVYGIGKKTKNPDDLDMFYPDHFSVMGLESQKCAVGTSHVRTFDGFTFNYTASQCWTVAYKDCSHTLGAMLLVRSPQGESPIPEVRYISENQQFVIDIEHKRIRINGKEIDMFGDSEIVSDVNGKQIATIFKKNDYFMIQFSKDYYIAVKEDVHIKVPEEYKTITCGLCGDFNGEPVGDLVGPEKCLYDDANTFVAAWTAPSDTCDTYEIFALREKAENFKKTCKIEHHATYQSHDVYDTKYNWQIKRDEEKACISMNPVPYCDYLCLDIEMKLVIYQCWKIEDVPAFLKTALDNGEDHMFKPLQIQEHFTEETYEMLPTACRLF